MTKEQQGDVRQRGIDIGDNCDQHIPVAWELVDWPLGTIKILGNKIYRRCCDCGKIVHINKWLFGGLHVCLTEEEIVFKQTMKEKT